MSLDIFIFNGRSTASELAKEKGSMIHLLRVLKSKRCAIKIPFKLEVPHYLRYVPHYRGPYVIGRRGSRAVTRREAPACVNFWVRRDTSKKKIPSNPTRPTTRHRMLGLAVLL